MNVPHAQKHVQRASLLFLACSLAVVAENLTLKNIGQPPDPTTWKGHLQPLGAAAAEKKSVDIIEGFPSPEEFFDDYLTTNTPVLMRGAAKAFPAYSKWSDEYFVSFKEAETYPVTAEQRKKENRKHPPKRPSFKTFVETYREKDIYMVNGVPKFLQKDIYLPTPLLCGGYVEKQLQDTVMWFSSGGTSSVLHHDDVENINCLFRGTKDFVMIPEKYKKEVALDQGGASYSSVDVDKVDFTKFPGLRNVEYYFAHMEPGDCLYIPLYSYHQVRSTGVNIAVNVWFNPIKRFEWNDCRTKRPLNISQPLDAFKFHAIEEELYGQNTAGADDGEEPSADNVEDEGAMLPEDMRVFFRQLMEKEMSLDEEEFTERLRQHELFHIEGVIWNDELKQWSDKAFRTLDVDTNLIIDRKEVSRWSQKKEEEVEKLVVQLEDALENMLKVDPNTSDQASRQQNENELEFEDEPNSTENDGEDDNKISKDEL